MKAKREVRSGEFGQFGLSEPLLKAIGDVGYETPSPIQLKTIPLLLAGRDVAGQALVLTPFTEYLLTHVSD